MTNVTSGLDRSIGGALAPQERHKMRLILNSRMAQEIGRHSDKAPIKRPSSEQAKKKGCKKKKCSHWKGGQCRCGRE